MDNDLIVSGWEGYKDDAIRLRNQYNGHIQKIFDQYGIRDETQLVSGHMIHIRNRLSDGEKEDFSFWNTEKIISKSANDQQMLKLWKKFRLSFFNEWGQALEDFRFDINDANLVLPLKAKASAWYIVAYDTAHGNNRFFLSFPWIVWDTLKSIKREKVFGSVNAFGDQSNILLDPITEHLYREIRGRTSPERNLYQRAYEGCAFYAGNIFVSELCCYV